MRPERGRGYIENERKGEEKTGKEREEGRAGEGREDRRERNISPEAKNSKPQLIWYLIRACFMFI